MKVMDEPLGIFTHLATSNWASRYACIKSWSRLDVDGLNPSFPFGFAAQEGCLQTQKSPLRAGGRRWCV
jgi:hypothetical protein